MNKYLAFYRWCNKVITAVLIASFCYSVVMLCWAMVTPDQNLFINALHESNLKMNLLCWGVFFGFYLGFTGMASATWIAENEFRKPVRLVVRKMVFDYCLCLGFILGPIIIFKSHEIIRESIHPILIVAATVLFLITIIHRYFKINRDALELGELRVVARA